MVKRNVLCLLAVGLLYFAAHSQPIAFEKIAPTYQLEELPLNIPDTRINIFHTAFDNDGYLWLSTNNGLWQFDGQHSQQFINGSEKYPILKRDLSSNFYELIKDNEGNFITSIWGEELLIKYNHDERRVVDTLSFKKSYLFEQLLYRIDSENTIYFTAINKETERYSLNKVEENNVIQTLFEIPQVNGVDDKLVQLNIVKQTIFLLTDTQLYVLNLKGDLLHTIDTSNGWANWPSTYSDAENFYIINELNATMFRWDFKTQSLKSHFKFPNAFSNHFSVFAVINHTIVCFREDGLFIYNILNKTYQEVKKNETETATKIEDHLYLIDNGILIKDDGSVFLFEPKRIYRLFEKTVDEDYFKEKMGDYIEDLSFRGLTEDSNKNIYVTFYTAELAKKEPSADHFTILKIPENPKINFESTYAISMYGNDLIFNNTRINFRKNTIKTLKENGLYLHTNHFVKGDSLWFFTWSTNEWEYYNLKTQQKKTYPFDVSAYPEVRFNVINAIVEDEKGKNLYVASQYNGITELTKRGKVIHSYNAEKLQINRERGVYDLYLDPPFLWYGSFNGLGVLNLEDKSVKIFSLSDDLGKNTLSGREVFFILPLSENEFYLGTDNGLVLFNKQTGSYFELEKGNPLATKEYNRNSYLRASNGKFYVGTTSGLYSFFPEDLKWETKKKYEKKVRINLISVFNSNGKSRYLSEGVNQLKTLYLKPDDVNIEIDFSSLQIDEEVLYSHKIDGITAYWSDYSRERKLNLAGISPGEYQLHIRTVNSPEKFKSLLIHKSQYWYLRWYSQMGFALLIIVFIGLLIRYRYRLELQKERELADLRVKISSDLHDDVGSLLTSVAMQSELLGKKSTGNDSKILKRIENLSREAMSSMRDTVWSIDSRKDDLQGLISRMKDFMVSSFQDNETFTYELKISQDINPKQKINPLIRQQVYLIFKEALTNVIKHCDGDFVVIHFNCSKTLLFMEIHDNGKSEKHLKTSGLGITNMKMRVKKLNGDLQIDSENGFHIVLKMPLS